MKTDTERVMAILADGRWHSCNEFCGRLLPNFRSRISELVKIHGSEDKPLPDGSYRFEWRWRTHKNNSGSTSTSKDWRINDHDTSMREEIAERHASRIEASGLVVPPAAILEAVEAEFMTLIDPFRVAP